MGIKTFSLRGFNEVKLPDVLKFIFKHDKKKILKGGVDFQNQMLG